MKNPKFEQEIRKQIGSSIDTSELDREYDGLKDRLSQTTGAKNRHADQSIIINEADTGQMRMCLKQKELNSQENMLSAVCANAVSVVLI